MADPQVYNNDLKRLQAKYEDFGRQLRELHTLTDSQFERTVQRMLELVDNLDARVDTAIQQRSLTVDQIAARDAATLSSANAYAEPKIGILPANKGGTGVSNSYNNDLSNTARRSSWVDSNGNMGIALSTEQVKQDIELSDVTEQDLRDINIVKFRYKEAVQTNGDSAQVEFGVIAEQVDGKVPDVMLYRDDDGKVIGFEYMLSGLLGLRLAQFNAERLDALEARIKNLENIEEEL